MNEGARSEGVGATAGDSFGESMPLDQEISASRLGGGRELEERNRHGGDFVLGEGRSLETRESGRGGGLKGDEGRVNSTFLGRLITAVKRRAGKKFRSYLKCV